MKKVLILILIGLVFSGCSFGKKKVVEVEDEKVIPVENQLKKSSFSVVGGVEEDGVDRAKAVESDWKVYENKEAGISFKYPPNIGIEEGSEYKLSVRVKSVEELNDTMGFDRETALSNVEALRIGKYGEDVDWPLTESKRIKKIGSVNAQEYMVLSRFEICDVVFERSLYFFNNERQIVITLAIAKDDVIKEASRYFKYNKDNCGKDKIWDIDLQKEFWDDIKNGKGSKKAQVWFDSFDSIVSTVALKDVVDNVKKIQGRWQSTKDEKTVIEFVVDTRINFYDGKKEDEGKFAFYVDYPVVEGMKAEIDGEHLIVKDGDDDSFDYKISKLTDEALELIYMARGNILSYKKIK